GSINQSAAHNCKRFSPAAGYTLRDVGQSCHPIGSRDSNKFPERALITFANGFEVVELSINRHGGGEIALRVEPQCLAPPDEPFYRVAVERFVFAADCHRVVAA